MYLTMQSQKFKADPYNPSNHLLSIQNVLDILKRVDINDYQPRT